MASINQGIPSGGTDRHQGGGIIPFVNDTARLPGIKPQRYRARYLGGIWGIVGPKGFVGCSGWTYAEVAGRVRTMNAVIDALDAVDGPE